MKSTIRTVLATLIASATFVASAGPSLLTPYEGARVAGSQAPAQSGGSAVGFNLAGLQGLKPGDEVDLALPNGRQYTVVFDLLKDHKDGTLSFIGYIKGTIDKQRVIITTHTDGRGSIGSIVTPDGEYAIAPGPNHDWLVDLRAEQALTGPIDLGRDTMPMPRPTAKAATMDMSWQAQTMSVLPGINQIAVSQAAPSPHVIVDMLFIYTPGWANTLTSNSSSVNARLNQLITAANTAYADSEIAMTLRMVHAEQITYTETGAGFNALCDITPVPTNQTGCPNTVIATFANVENLRTTWGADMVSLMRGTSTFGGAGIAWVTYGPIGPGAVNYMYSDTRGCVLGCDFVWIHEVGHNMGNNHDRATVAWQAGGVPANQVTLANMGGSYEYSYGFYHCSTGNLKCNPNLPPGSGGCAAGTQPECSTVANNNVTQSPSGNNNFSDIMAYFHNSTLRNMRFSNFHLNCQGNTGPGVACGVYEGNSMPANASLSMNNNRVALSALKPTVVPVGPVASTTALATSQNPVVNGVTVTFTATVTGGYGTPTGNVSFFEDGNPLCGPVALNGLGKATCATSALPNGSHAITANYAGSASYNPSVSNTVNQGVYTPVPVNPTIVVTPSKSPQVFGQPVTFTATVSGSAGVPAGNVSFFDGATPLCGPLALDGAGKATCTTSALTVGSHAITAQYAGSMFYNAGTSPPLNIGIYIPVLPSATLSIVPSQSPQVIGVPVIFTLLTSGGSGLVQGTATFRDGGVNIAGCVSVPLDGSGRASCTAGSLGLGAHAITVQYSGNATYAASTSPTLNLSVYNPTGPAPTITISPSQNPAIVGTNVIFETRVSGGMGMPTGAVTFRSNGTPIPSCQFLVLQTLTTNSVARCVTNTLGIGTTAITVQYHGSSVYGPVTSSAFNQGMYTNGKPVPTISVAPSQNPAPAATVITFTATLGGGSGTPTGNVIFLSNLSTIGACAARPLTGGVATCSINLPIGINSIMVIYQGNTTYNANTSTPFNQGIY